MIHHQSRVRYADGTTLPVLCNEVPLDPSIVPTFPEDGSGSAQRDQEARLADWLHEVVESMYQSVERLTMLTNDLLDVTRLQAGSFPLQCEPQDLVASSNG